MSIWKKVLPIEALECQGELPEYKRDLTMEVLQFLEHGGGVTLRHSSKKEIEELAISAAQLFYSDPNRVLAVAWWRIVIRLFLDENSESDGSLVKKILHVLNVPLVVEPRMHATSRFTASLIKSSLQFAREIAKIIANEYEQRAIDELMSDFKDYPEMTSFMDSLKHFY
jgi:hypothetical protein